MRNQRPQLPDTEHRLIRRRWLTLGPFYVLIALSVASYVVLLVGANQPASRKDDWPWNVHVPNIPGAVLTLFVASVGWLLVRDHNARVLRPVLGYTSDWVGSSNLRTSSARYRRVVLEDNGPGTAFIRKVTWRLQTAAYREPVEIETIGALCARFASLGLREGYDYSVTNVSPGGSIRSQGNETYFECTATDGEHPRVLPTAKEQVLVLDAVFIIESMVGDQFERVVKLLPHSFAPDVISDVPSDGPSPP
jgi:hypothetical protein